MRQINILGEFHVALQASALKLRHRSPWLKEDSSSETKSWETNRLARIEAEASDWTGNQGGPSPAIPLTLCAPPSGLPCRPGPLVFSTRERFFWGRTTEWFEAGTRMWVLRAKTFSCPLNKYLVTEWLHTTRCKRHLNWGKWEWGCFKDFCVSSGK